VPKPQFVESLQVFEVVNDEFTTFRSKQDSNLPVLFFLQNLVGGPYQTQLRMAFDVAENLTQGVDCSLVPAFDFSGRLSVIFALVGSGTGIEYAH